MTDDPTASPEASAPPVAVIRGYEPGLIGTIVTFHALTYSHWAGFGSAFECKVASELADFVTHLDRPNNALWHARSGDHILGSIAIDGEDLGERAAHLRWFIVDPASRGSGVGHKLLKAALDFVDSRGFDETRLWTLKGLEAARSLYERSGFVMVETYDGDQWGTVIKEQIFVRKGGSRG